MHSMHLGLLHKTHNQDNLIVLVFLPPAFFLHIFYNLYNS